MVWIVVAAVVVALALIVAVGVRLRRAAAAVVVVAIVLTAVYVGYRVRQAPKPIPLSDVEVEYYRVASGSTGTEMGRIHNKSTRYTVTALEFEETLRDCVGDGCTVLAVYPHRKLYGLSVDPGATVSIAGFSYDGPLPAKRGEYRWEYRVVSAEGH